MFRAKFEVLYKKGIVASRALTDCFLACLRLPSLPSSDLSSDFAHCLSGFTKLERNREYIEREDDFDDLVYLSKLEEPTRSSSNPEACTGAPSMSPPSDSIDEKTQAKRVGPLPETTTNGM